MRSTMGSVRVHVFKVPLRAAVGLLGAVVRPVGAVVGLLWGPFSGSIQDRSRIDPGSILDRSRIDPGSILYRSWIDHGSIQAHGTIFFYYINIIFIIFPHSYRRMPGVIYIYIYYKDVSAFILVLFRLLVLGWVIGCGWGTGQVRPKPPLP